MSLCTALISACAASCSVAASSHIASCMLLAERAGFGCAGSVQTQINFDTLGASPVSAQSPLAPAVTKLWNMPAQFYLKDYAINGVRPSCLPMQTQTESQLHPWLLHRTIQSGLSAFHKVSDKLATGDIGYNKCCPSAPTAFFLRS